MVIQTTASLDLTVQLPLKLVSYCMHPRCDYWGLATHNLGVTYIAPTNMHLIRCQLLGLACQLFLP